jgi:hypothetical protein
LINDFEAVSESVEELRTDFKRMAYLNKTPYEFGLKVRQSPTGIAITAANKMRSAKEISLAEDFSTRHIQAHSLHDDIKENEKNMDRAQAFINNLNEFHKNTFEISSKPNAMVWKSVPSKLILAFIKTMSFPQTEFDLLSSDESSLLTSYIEDRAANELKEWDVGVPYVARGEQTSVPFPLDTGLTVFCRKRSGTSRESESVIKVNVKNTITFGKDDFSLGEDRKAYEERIDQVINEATAEALAAGDPNPREPSVTWAHSKARTRPLLLIHFLQLDPDEKVQLKLPINAPVVSVGILLPGTSIRCVERRYKASKRLIEMLNKLREETETDEELEDE